MCKVKVHFDNGKIAEINMMESASEIAGFMFDNSEIQYYQLDGMGKYLLFESSKVVFVEVDDEYK